DAKAIERLFGRLRTLAGAGVTMLFISHHLQEVYGVCDTVTVLRDARWILTAPVADVGHDALVAAMTGEAVGLTDVAPRPAAPPGTPAVLRLQGLALEGAFDPLTLEVKAGEIVGVTGSGSSGKVSLAETVGGLRKATVGTVLVGTGLRKPSNDAGSAADGAGRA